MIVCRQCKEVIEIGQAVMGIVEGTYDGGDSVSVEDEPLFYHVSCWYNTEATKEEETDGA